MTYSLGTILDEAKVKREGHLKTLNLALIAYGGIIMLLALPSAIAELAVLEPEVITASRLIFDAFLTPLLTVPLLTGIMCLGVARAREQPIKVRSIFGHYNKMWSLYGFTLLYWLIFVLIGLFYSILLIASAGSEILPVVSTIGIIAIFLFSIYMGIMLCFAILLIVDQGLGVIAAIKRSIAAVRLSGSFALLFNLYFMLFLWTILGLFTLGIAYFWIFPKYIIAFGIIYRDLFDGDRRVPVAVEPKHQGPLAKYSQAG